MCVCVFFFFISLDSMSLQGQFMTWEWISGKLQVSINPSLIEIFYVYHICVLIYKKYLICHFLYWKECIYNQLAYFFLMFRMYV